ncbi:hypothetical protein MASR1M12_12530 [Erysipelotrichia bacterium]
MPDPVPPAVDCPVAVSEPVSLAHARFDDIVNLLPVDVFGDSAEFWVGEHAPDFGMLNILQQFFCFLPVL